MVSHATGSGSSSEAFGAGFDAMTRQFWNTWAGAMQGTPSAGPTMGMQDAMSWWSRLMPGQAVQPNVSDMFAAQGHFWQAQMGRLAEKFVGGQPTAHDLAQAWRQMLGDNPFAGLAAGVQVPGQFDVAQWVSQVMPWLNRLQSEGKQWLDLPTFGFAREHQQRWQQLAQAQMDHQQQVQVYQSLLGQAAQDSFGRFETRLKARSESGEPIATARGLFDVWIDAAEEAYAELALSPRFREAYGNFVNSQMRLRGAVQGEVERLSEGLGVPGRTEVDAAHRKIAQLERELRRMRDDVSRLVELQARPEAAPNRVSAKPQQQAAPVITQDAAQTNRSTPVSPASVAAKDPLPSPKPAAKAAAKPAAQSVGVTRSDATQPAKSSPTSSSAKSSKGRRP